MKRNADIGLFTDPSILIGDAASITAEAKLTSNPGGNAKPERFVVKVSEIDRFTKCRLEAGPLGKNPFRVLISQFFGSFFHALDDLVNAFCRVLKMRFEGRIKPFFTLVQNVEKK